MYKDLPLSDRARIIGLAVKSGITDLSTIEEVYNRFDEGGPKSSIKEKLASKMKDVAYKIATQKSVYTRGNANIFEVAAALIGKKETSLEDDNKRAYIYGTGERFPEVKEPVEGFDYTNYLNKYGYEGVKNVYGTINPYGKYHIDKEYEPLVRALAENKYHFYDNADDIFLETDPDVLGYRDDVANFIHQFGTDENGNVVINDSDVYDFNPADYDYTRGSGKLLTKLEAKLMDKIGTPYIIRQERQPVIFDNEGTASFNIMKHLDNLTLEDIAKATNSGLIDPAELVVDEHEDEIKEGMFHPIKEYIQIY